MSEVIKDKDTTYFLNIKKILEEVPQSLLEEIRKTNESIKQAESELEDTCDIEDSDDRQNEETELNQIITKRNIDLDELNSKLDFHDECVKYLISLIKVKREVA